MTLLDAPAAEDFECYAGLSSIEVGPDCNSLSHRAHEENCVAGWIEQIERTCAPIVIFWRSQSIHSRAPLTIIVIGVIHLKGYASISAMSIHGTIQSDLYGSKRYPEQTGMSVFRCFEPHAET